MKNVITALMTAHFIYYMNQKDLMNGIPSLAIAIVLGIILVISDYC